LVEIRREIRFEEERDRRFHEEIKRIPGCDLMDRCIQCGTCSGICPLSVYMEHTPRQIIALTRAGFKKDVLHSNAIWLCTSCYACTTECPKQIVITDLMYALKRRAIEDGVFPKRYPIPILAQEFYKMVYKTGRVTESQLVQRLYLRTKPLGMLAMSRLGLNLLKTRRMSLKADRMERPKELRRVLDNLEPLQRRRQP
jgi:heterodisulfide reductase subunit C